ncbi:LysR family transcriptional regulator [Lichenicoccus sp.]|uniref:LysR family transcriptional regulator n=1 Tax=Lichenicoccus sp. TaxID=2781899 RepID=UPI003D11A8B7
MRLFVRVVERRNFRAAAADLGLPRSSATAGIKALEAELGAALLRRTTRHVAPTEEGEAYHRHCVSVLADIDDAEAALRGGGGNALGVLRVDTNAHLARTWLLPELPRFLERHPGLRFHLGEGDRLVNLVREGVDCVIRGGEIDDSDLMIRRLGLLAEVTCASPAYLARHGTPSTTDDLAGHEMVGFVSSRTGGALPLGFVINGRVREVTLPARVTASSSDSCAVLARLGLGLVQAPLIRFADDLKTGAMVEVLRPFRPTPLPVSLLYPRTRLVPSRLRAFIDWLDEVLVPHLTD